MIKNFIFKNWVRIPIAVYIVGFLVHNFYLSTFNIYDFEIIQARYIYTGFICILFIASTYLFTFMRLNFSNYDDNLSFKNMYFWFYRISLFCITFYFLLFTNADLIQNKIPFLSDVSENNFRLITIASPMFLFFITFIGEAERNNINKRTYKILKVITIVFSPFLIVYSIFLTYYVNDYSDFHAFFMFIWFFAIMLIAGIIDAGHGLETLHLSDETSDLIQKKFRSAVSSISIIIVTLMTLNLYSKYVYPLISTSWGGGKSVNASIYANDKVYKGSLISESAQWTYIITDEHTLYKIRTGIIKEIELKINEKKEKANK